MELTNMLHLLRKIKHAFLKAGIFVTKSLVQFYSFTLTLSFLYPEDASLNCSLWIQNKQHQNLITFSNQKSGHHPPLAFPSHFQYYINHHCFSNLPPKRISHIFALLSIFTATSIVGTMAVPVSLCAIQLTGL